MSEGGVSGLLPQLDDPTQLLNLAEPSPVVQITAALALLEVAQGGSS